MQRHRTPVRIRHLIFVRIPSGMLQGGNANESVGSSISFLPMAADPPLGRSFIEDGTVVQDRLLNGAENRFIRIVVRASFRHAGPVQVQLSQDRTSDLGLDGMRRGPIQGDPHGHSRRPSTHAPQELTDILGSFARDACPGDAARIHLVEQEQVEPSPGLLRALQHQAFRGSVTSAARGLHRDGRDIEVSQDCTTASVVPPRGQALQDHASAGIGGEELASHATQAVPPVFSTRRRYSQLMCLTMRCWIR